MQAGERDGADALLFRTHMAVRVFSLATAWLLFVAGGEVFGPLAGLIAWRCGCLTRRC